MKSVRARSGAVLVALACAMLSFDGPAHAERDCSSRFVDRAAKLSPPRFAALPPRLRALVDARLRRGELNDLEFHKFLAHLARRQLYPAVGVGLASWGWTLARDHYHWHDVWSQHQSNFLRGFAPAFVVDYWWRFFTGDESGGPTRKTLALLIAGNVAFETPVFGLPFDPGDLTAGTLAALTAYVIYRFNESEFRRHHLGRPR